MDAKNRRVRTKYVVRGVHKGGTSKDFESTYDYREATVLANQIAIREAKAGRYYKIHITEMIEMY